jgi:hypothetical protein
MVQMLELALYPRIYPARVLLGHPDNQLTDLLHHAGATDSLPWIRPLSGDEPAVPCEDCVGSYNRDNLAQDIPTQRSAFGGQSATLVVGETKAFPALFELLFQNTILLDQVRDRL